MGTGRLVRAVHLGRSLGVTGLAFGPNDRSVWIANADWERPNLMLVDIRTGLMKVYPTGHRSLIKQVLASRDGRIVATAGDDRIVRVFDATTVSPLHTLSGHEGRKAC